MATAHLRFPHASALLTSLVRSLPPVVVPLAGLLGLGEMRAQSVIVYQDGENRSAPTIVEGTTTLSTLNGFASQSGVISGDGELIKTGSGWLTLAAANTFTGTTTIEAGTLALAHSLALQNSTLHLSSTGGAIDFGSLTSITLGGLSGDRDLPLVHPNYEAIHLTVGQNNADTTFAGSLSGTGTFTKTGTGTLTLSGLSTRDGDIEAASGSLRVDGGSLTHYGNFTVGGHGQPVALTVTNNGQLFSSTPILLAGDAVQVRIENGGVVEAPYIENTAGSASLIFDGGTFRVTQDQQPLLFNQFAPDAVTFADGGATIDTRHHQSGIHTSVSGTGGLTKTGSGSLTLSGANTFSGITRIEEGILYIGNSFALQNSTLDYRADGGDIRFDAIHDVTLGGLSGDKDLVLTNRFDDSLVLTVGTNNRDTTYAGALSGANWIAKAGAGTLTLSGQSTLAGGIGVNSGTLKIDGGVLENEYTVVGSYGHHGTLVIANGGRVTVDSPLFLAPEAASATLRLESGGVLETPHLEKGEGTAAIVFDGGALRSSLESGELFQGFSGSDITLAADGAKFDIVNGAASISQSLSGPGGLTKTGAGSLALNGALTYTGATTLAQGTLILPHGSALQHSTLHLGGGLLDVGPFNSLTLGGLSGTHGLALVNAADQPLALTVGQNNADTTFSGVLSGPGSLTKTGSGDLTLSGENTFAGTTRIAQGTLTLAHRFALQNSVLDYRIGDGDLRFNVSPNATYHTAVLGGLSGDKDLVLTGQNNAKVELILNINDSDTVYSGSLQGNGYLEKTGSGTLTLAGGDHVLQRTTVTNGTLEIVGGSLSPDGPLLSAIGFWVGGRYNSHTKGVLRISDSATLTVAGDFLIGPEGTGEGEVFISGPHTSLNSENLRVGVQENGSLSLTDGASVFSNEGVVGFLLAPGLTGEATVSGADSSWQNSGAFTLGRVGTGILTVSDNASVVTQGAATLGAYANGNGRLNIESGGVFAAPYIAKGAGSASITIDGGILRATTDSFDFLQSFHPGDVVFASGGGVIDTQQFDVRITTSIAGSGGLTKIGSGELTFTAANTFSGVTSIAEGTLTLGHGLALQNSTLNYADTGGALGFSEIRSATLGGLSGDKDLSLSNHSGLSVDLVVGANNADTTYEGALGGSGGFTKVGAGTLRLTGENSYGGGTLVRTGTLEIDGGAISHSTHDLRVAPNANDNATMLIANGGTVLNKIGYVGGNSGSSGEVTVTGAGSTWINSDDLYIGGFDNSTGTLTISDGGEVIVSDLVTLGGSGSTGTLIVRDGGVLAAGAITQSPGSSAQLILDGGTLRALADSTFMPNTMSGGAVIAAGGVTFDTDHHDISINSQLSGVGGLIKTGSGSLTLSSATTFSGNTTIAQGTLVIGRSDALQNSTLVHRSTGGDIEFSSSVLNALLGGLSGDGAISLTNRTTSAPVKLEVGNNGPDTTFTGTLSGLGSFEKVGAGTLTLTGNHTHAGGTRVRGGVLKLEGGSISHPHGDLTVSYGTGEQTSLHLTDGARMTSGSVYVAFTTSGRGEISLAGPNSSLVATGQISLGTAGTGVLTIRNGATVSSASAAFGSALYGRGEATIEGPASQWTTTGFFSIGDYGSGSLSISDGATVSSGNSYIANHGGTTGLVNVTGPGSAWQISDGLNIGADGRGELTITDGALVTVDYASAIGGNSSGHGIVTVSGEDSAWNIAQTLTVGAFGRGELTVSGGASLSSTYAYIGESSGGDGHVTIQDTGSTWTIAESLEIGTSGAGSLLIKNGASVSAGDTYLGSGSGSTGGITVMGIGSRLNTGDLYLGEYGAGNMEVVDGAAVTTRSVQLSNGGSMFLAGGSSWTNDDGLHIGKETGEHNLLEVTEGSTIHTAYSVIGGDGAGRAYIYHPGSSWTNEEFLIVGGDNTGRLIVAEEAQVFSAEAGIGIYAPGEVLLGLGASWTNTYELQIGYESYGSLGVLYDGVVSSLGDIRLAVETDAVAEVTLESGGTLIAPRLTKGRGDVSLTLDGGILRATRNQADYLHNFSANDVTLGENGGTIDTAGHHIGIAAPLSGEGGPTKIGAGVLTLSGNHTYTGDTVVEAGTLIVNGSLAANTLTTVQSGATLAGSGTVGNLVLASGGTLAPGNSPGTLTVDGDATWDGGATYVWEINSADGTAGVNWDLLSISGTLTFGATAENPLTLSLVSLTLTDLPGLLADFDSSRSFGYTIAHAAGGIVGFDSAAVSINLAGFANSSNGGVWSLVQDGNDLTLLFTAAIPEPSAYSTLLGGLALLFASRRPRRRVAP